MHVHMEYKQTLCMSIWNISKPYVDMNQQNLMSIRISKPYVYMDYKQTLCPYCRQMARYLQQPSTNFYNNTKIHIIILLTIVLRVIVAMKVAVTTNTLPSLINRKKIRKNVEIVIVITLEENRSKITQDVVFLWMRAPIQEHKNYLTCRYITLVEGRGIVG
jgi:thiol-disulfide isomerase/thioredoxin